MGSSYYYAPGAFKDKPQITLAKMRITGTVTPQKAKEKKRKKKKKKRERKLHILKFFVPRRNSDLCRQRTLTKRGLCVINDISCVGSSSMELACTVFTLSSDVACSIRRELRILTYSQKT